MPDPSHFWHNPTAVRIVALLAVGLLVTTIWLFRRKKDSGRAAAFICLIVSVSLHVALIVFVPKLSTFFTGTADTEQEQASGSETFNISVFDPELDDDVSTDTDLAEMLSLPSENEMPEVNASISPLSLPESFASLQAPTVTPNPVPPDSDLGEPPPLPQMQTPRMPTALASTRSESTSNHVTAIEDALGDWLEETLTPPEQAPVMSDSLPDGSTTPTTSARSRAANVQRTENQSGSQAEEIDEDFASRIGTAKIAALRESGGDANTEIAVAAALRFLANHQRDDGAWDPVATGAGQERSPLGLSRGAAGKRAETGITGLALLSLLGAGHTHQSGDYQDNVYRGLAFLLGKQRADGSLAGSASVYAAHYCHAMAALAVAETAAMTRDPAAIAATQRAIAYSRSTQHPVTGGWRYTRGAKGDLSQLGWQAMLIDAAVRSGAIKRPHSMQQGVARFLNSVRSGASGGYACYRPGERPTATMTAEALATRLLIGQSVSPATVREAEAVLLRSLPGKTAGPDNYYQWYYATLALHQLQDDAWHQWNAALKQRLLSTQQHDGSWPDSTLWGGYGGSIYSTSMATLCLESYYRHAER